MRPSTAKVVRDLTLEKGRSFLAILAMALGIASFTAVLSSYAIIDRELNAGYLATNPAAFTLRLERADDAAAKIVRDDPDVDDAELRRAVTGRVRVGPAQWRNATFFVIRDFNDIKVSRLSKEEGAWPPAADEALIERDAFQVARKAIGEPMVVRTSRGDEITLRVAGRVHDVGQAQARMENSIYAYISVETLARFGEEIAFDRILGSVGDRKDDRAHIETVAERARAAVARARYSVRRVDVPDPGKHPHADLMAMLLLAISTFGLLILGFAGILVMNLMSGLMAGQVRQIGVMKAVGGRSSQIGAMYVSQALVYGVLAVVLGVPPGLLGARALCLYLAGFLNFDMMSFRVPAWVFGLVALVGLLTPLLASALPVLSALRVTVREALADFDSGGATFGGGIVDRALVRVGGPARPVILGVRNCFRRKLRSALTVMTLSVAGVFFMSALNVRASMIGSLDRLFATRRFDLSVSLSAITAYELVARAIAATPGVVKAEGWIASEASIVAGRPTGTEAAVHEPRSGPQSALHGGNGGPSASATDRFPVLAIPPQTDLLRLDMGEGRPLSPGAVDEVVPNSRLVARHPSLRVGHTITMRLGPSERRLRVVGIASEPFSPAMAYISREVFERAGHGEATNSLRIVLRSSDAASIESFREALDKSLAAESLRALSASSSNEARYGFDQHMLMIYVFLIVMSVIIGAVGGLGLATTMGLNILERRREMGVLRAIGASHRSILAIVVIEGLTVSLLSSLIAALFAIPISQGLAAFIGSTLFRSEVAFAFDPRGLVIWIAIATILGVAASFAPAWRAARSPVREALAFE